MFATPDAAEHAFYEALEQADPVRLMQVWADEEDIVCIHPDGLRAIGHDAVQESWMNILARGPVHLRPLQLKVMSSMMCAVHVLVEQTVAPMGHGRTVQNTYATNVYHKGPAGWRMVMHHASLAPAEAVEHEMRDVPTRLH